ncbi:DUF1015 domain-containing protein [Anaerotalea alkaliphila]|uniref:DUF1015 domain-containing protein n=1 Tax=Anaerotalea alkaliphila TaxID=2662126 RepID=A0A7X5HUL5_9FIRM|nr:DUF1015 family protein [Anaerotalea alkaliphila]NDL66924.1 DUF1015 domain-containing protein [Anaerotalea alkaliphila]
MAILKPFQGVRPRKDLAAAIAALPYDVYSREEAREEVKDKPLSFLRIDRAETFFPPDQDMYADEVYGKAREALYGMLESGEFIQDSEDSFYIYRLTMDGRPQTGLVACTSIDDYLEGRIKKHELTRESKEQDRIRHVDACNANTGPIFLAYQAKDAVDGLVEGWMGAHGAEYDITTEDGVRHQVWRIGDRETNSRLVELFAAVPSLYIADGHHRAASAVKVGQKRRLENPGYTGKEEFNYFLSVLFPDNQLKILDYNRVVKDLNGMDKGAFLEAVKGKFLVEKESGQAIRPVEKATFGMFLDGTWYLLRAKEGIARSENPVEALDVSILQNHLLAPVLGIQDPRTDERIDFVGGIRGLEELERRVRKDMAVAFAMVPTGIDELMSIADAGALMPPKSTWFEPKLRSGLFIHLLA